MGRLGVHLCLVNRKPAPAPTHPLALWIHPGWFPCSGLGPGPGLCLGGKRQRSPERPSEVPLLRGDPGLWLEGSPCWPKTMWVLRCSDQPHSPVPHTPQLEQSSLTTGRKGGAGRQQTAKVTNKGLRKHQKVCRGGGPLEEVVGEEGLPPGAFWGDGCKGQVFNSQLGPLRVPFPCQCHQVHPSLCSRTHAHRKGPVHSPAQYHGWIIIKGSQHPESTSFVAQTSTMLSGSHVPPLPVLNLTLRI